MKLLAHGHAGFTVHEELPVLKDAVKQATGNHVRRIGRFIQLALIGAGQCTHGQSLPPATAVYLSSGRGDLEVTLEVLAGMVEHGQAPKPLSFINTVSNSACFYVAKTFGLHGRSQFVTRRHAPLESALQLAALDLATGAVPFALVGVVDIVTAPVADHRVRLQLPADAPVGEASHWFLCAPDSYTGPAIARFGDIRTLPDREALCDWVEAQGIDAATWLAVGQHVPDDRVEDLQRISGLAQCLPYRLGLPWYDSQAGAALAGFLTTRPAPQLLYVDTDAAGRYSVMPLHLA